MGVAGKNRHLEIFFRVYVTLSSIERQDHSRARGVHGVWILERKVTGVPEKNRHLGDLNFDSL